MRIAKRTPGKYQKTIPLTRDNVPGLVRFFIENGAPAKTTYWKDQNIIDPKVGTSPSHLSRFLKKHLFFGNDGLKAYMENEAGVDPKWSEQFQKSEQTTEKLAYGIAEKDNTALQEFVAKEAEDLKKDPHFTTLHPSKFTEVADRLRVLLSTKSRGTGTVVEEHHILAFLLRAFHGCTYPAIGENMGDASDNSTRNWVGHAYRKLIKTKEALPALKGFRCSVI